jgi:cell division transport system ATP-binding protein
VIRFDRVHKRYPNGREALSELSFEIADGEMAFLTGRSGAGKSSVLKLIALLERPTRGQLIVNGQGTSRLPLRRVALFRRQLGIVFQDHRLLMDRPVFDNVALPLIVADTSFKEIDRRVRAALDQVGLLGKERVVPIELSVGEQQRVGIARAIVSKPPLLVADEPTGNLDATLAAEVMELFRRFNEVGVTVVIATHDRRLVQAAGRREIMLEEGRVQLDSGAATESTTVADVAALGRITTDGPEPEMS